MRRSHLTRGHLRALTPTLAHAEKMRGRGSNCWIYNPRAGVRPL